MVSKHNKHATNKNIKSQSKTQKQNKTMNAKLILNIKLSWHQIIVAIILALVMLAGITYIYSPNGYWTVEGFESLCDSIENSKNRSAKARASPSASLSNGINPNTDGSTPISRPVTITLPETDEDRAQLDDIVNTALQPPDSYSNESEDIMYEEEGATACDMLVKPDDLSPEQLDTATELDRQLSNSVLPSTAEEREKLYEEVKNTLASNTTIPKAVSSKISDEDARSVIILIAVEKQAANGEMSPEEAKAARKLLEAKGFGESPKRGILQQLSRQIAPVEINETMRKNGAKPANPEILAAFTRASKENNRVGANTAYTRQDTLAYSRHRALFTNG